ncbi:MAG: 2-phospho-L-lactate guanylyltransferase [Streptosporangiales bacterium]|nr:2-phospho-L-lactate guanylyltransferase [Streptosporangiales bacterium]
MLRRAKSRLAVLAGPDRERLALAVATDTVSAALRCRQVRAVVVVTDDPVAAPALAELGARVVSDEPDAGLNPALRHGAGAAAVDPPPGGSGGVGALSADLPALRPEELGRALGAAGERPHAFVPDAAGIGTTLYAARWGEPFEPAFGPGSRLRHLDAGAYELALPDIATLRRDVDTPADLEAALRLGVGPRTAEVVEALGLRVPGR